MQVKIYHPVKTPTQSGKKDKLWLLLPVMDQKYQSTTNFMGWTSSNNTLMQLKLKFQSLEEAIKYAEEQGWEYEVVKPQTAKIIKKSYADNFL